MDSTYLHASVLIPLFQEDGGYKVLLTKRTNRVEHHKGQISFPGGRVDEGDASLKQTALREAHEEVGLISDHVKILGQLDDALTVVSNFIVHPFVGLIPNPYPFRINPYEVEKLIQVPLNIFFPEDSIHKDDSIDFEDLTYSGPFYKYQDNIIWGATARIMENFIEIVGGKISLPAGRK